MWPPTSTFNWLLHKDLRSLRTHTETLSRPKNSLSHHHFLFRTWRITQSRPGNLLSPQRSDVFSTQLTSDPLCKHRTCSEFRWGQKWTETTWTGANMLTTALALCPYSDASRSVCWLTSDRLLNPERGLWVCGFVLSYISRASPSFHVQFLQLLFEKRRRESAESDPEQKNNELKLWSSVKPSGAADSADHSRADAWSAARLIGRYALVRPCYFHVRRKNGAQLLLYSGARGMYADLMYCIFEWQLKII